jgi:hypothetical protein
LDKFGETSWKKLKKMEVQLTGLVIQVGAQKTRMLRGRWIARNVLPMVQMGTRTTLGVELQSFHVACGRELVYILSMPRDFVGSSD